MKNIYFRGSRSKKQIAITFDDGPCKDTLKVLKILKKYNIPATFFVLGKKIKGNESIIKQIIKQKCEIGIHGYSHLNFVFKSKEWMAEEIERTEEKLAKLRIKTNLVRFPHFMFGFNALSTIKKFNKKAIFVDIDSRDWLLKSSSAVSKRVLRKARNGSIIGFHDYIEEVGENKVLMPALKIILPGLKTRGYKFITVSKLLNLN